MRSKQTGISSYRERYVHPVCQQFPSFNALMSNQSWSCSRSQSVGLAGTGEWPGQGRGANGATKPRQCRQCRVLMAMLLMMASLTHFPSRLWAWQTTVSVSGPLSLSLSHALSMLDPFPAFEVRGELLIFFVFTLTFEAKRRKLIEGLISTQPATHSHTHSKTHTNKGKLTAKRDCVNMAYD